MTQQVANRVYIAATEGHVGKSVVALGLVEALAGRFGSLGVFRPVVKNPANDPITRVLVAEPSVQTSYEQSIGVSYADVAHDPEAAMGTIIERFGALRDLDAVVIIGSDYSDLMTPTELSLNAEIAAHLDAPVIFVSSAKNMAPDNLPKAAAEAVSELEAHHNSIAGVIATRVPEDRVDAVRAGLAELFDVPVNVLPENPLQTAPTVRQQFEAVDAELMFGDDAMLDRETLGVLVASMTLPNVLNRLEPEFTVVAAADREELIPGLVSAQLSDAYPNQAALLLVGGYDIPESIITLMESLSHELPVGRTKLGTYATSEKLFGMQGISISSPRKVEAARTLFRDHVDAEALVDSITGGGRAQIRTPLMFQYQTMEMARSNKKTIVLPESEDDRILQAADILLQRDVANLVLLGDEATIKEQAARGGFSVDGAQIMSMSDEATVQRFAEEYAKLRAHKGVTIEQARERMADPSYFATMMVHLGMADGMVSGATHTTANTIRPALEFIKTRPGVSVVSGSFLMCLPDKVFVYADCAVNPDPTAEQLADIAISSAETAEAFGIEPRVAMLSYSTGTSGKGADVDKVREATELVRERAPELKVEGPIQFDAAVDPAVGQKKMPGSDVAGQATVFIFPDLNTGNNTYKAVQRTAGAVAVGPMLQGLNKPVNDLSRGALVEDIVNTVAITAIQAATQTKEN